MITVVYHPRKDHYWFEAILLGLGDCEIEALWLLIFVCIGSGSDLRNILWPILFLRLKIFYFNYYSIIWGIIKISSNCQKKNIKEITGKLYFYFVNSHVATFSYQRSRNIL